MLSNAQKAVVDKFNIRREEHSQIGAADAAMGAKRKRKPRIFPIKGPKSEEAKRKINGYIATGIFNGEHISVPGFSSSWDAHNYGARKGWGEIVVVTSWH